MRGSYMASLAPLITVSLGIGLYQLCLKRMPELDNPFRLLSIVYTLTALVTFTLSQIFPSNIPHLQIVKDGGFALALLSLAPVVIEIGYLWAFRAGWKLGLLNVVISSSCVILMLCVGFILYRERITATQFCGVLLCVAGFVLATKPA